MLAKKFGFGVGIAIVLPLLVYYGVSTFFPAPKWENDYGNNYYNDSASSEEKKKWHDENQKKQKKYQEERKYFERHLFYVATPVGITAIIIGSILSVQAIGAGLIFGGILTVANGYCWYWSELSDWMRFLSLLIAFIVIIWCGYKKLNEGQAGQR